MQVEPAIKGYLAFPPNRKAFPHSPSRGGMPFAKTPNDSNCEIWAIPSNRVALKNSNSDSNFCPCPSKTRFDFTGPSRRENAIRANFGVLQKSESEIFQRLARPVGPHDVSRARRPAANLSR